jgi:peptidyl-prolyl cis-trans isomerase B (cyclophilin B)
MLRARNKSLGILFIVAIAFSAYIYFYEVKYKDKQKEAKLAEEQIFQTYSTTTKQVRLKTETEEMVWVKNAGQWNFTKPMTAEGDTTAIDQALQPLFDAKFDKRVPNIKLDQLKNFGIDSKGSGTTFVEFMHQPTPDAPESYTTLLLGSLTPVDDNFYAMVLPHEFKPIPTNTEAIPTLYVLPKAIKTSLNKSLKDFRSKSILNFSTSTIETIQIKGQNKKEKFHLRRNHEPKTNALISKIDWWIDQHYPANTDTVDTILSGFKNLKAKDFIDETPTPNVLTKYGLHLPDVSVSLTQKDNQVITINYRKDPKKKSDGLVHVVGKNLLYRVTDTDAQNSLNPKGDNLYLNNPFKRLRLNQLLGVLFRYRNSDALEIAPDPANKDQWQLYAKDKPVSEAPITIKPDKVTAFEEMLNKLEVKNYKTNTTSPTLESGWPMEIVFKYKDKSERIWIKPLDNHILFQVPTSGLELSVEKSTLPAPIEPFFTFAYFYDPLNPPEAEISKTEINNTNTGELKVMKQPLSTKIEKPSKEWARNLKDPRAVLEIEGKGKVVIDLDAENAPLTVSNFVNLATHNFYDGLTFHRVIQDFMAQGGDPTGNGTGGPGYQFEDETTNGLTNDRGALSMANSGPNTNGSQFFIVFKPQPHLNGKHTVFGKVVEGMEVVDAISQGDKIKSIQIETH